MEHSIKTGQQTHRKIHEKRNNMIQCTIVLINNATLPC